MSFIFLDTTLRLYKDQNISWICTPTTSTTIITVLPKKAIIVLTILLGQKGKLCQIWTFQVWERFFFFFLSNSIVEREDI